jgi:predicted nucleic acid-binding protein
MHPIDDHDKEQSTRAKDHPSFGMWALRGNAKAARAVDDCDARSLSAITFLELLQGARDKHEARGIKAFLADMQFRVLPLTENVGHRALIYIEEYGHSVLMGTADALIVAHPINLRGRRPRPRRRDAFPYAQPATFQFTLNKDKGSLTGSPRQQLWTAFFISAHT